jgi:hypothetical protein
MYEAIYSDNMDRISQAFANLDDATTWLIQQVQTGPVNIAEGTIAYQGTVMARFQNREGQVEKIT